jgi:hypothetical protein
MDKTGFDSQWMDATLLFRNFNPSMAIFGLRAKGIYPQNMATDSNVAKTINHPPVITIFWLVV